MESLFTKSNNINDRLFILGEELHKLHEKRQKLCASLGDGIYQSKDEFDIMQNMAQIKSIDDEIEEKQKELRELDTYMNEKREQKNEKNS